jgi:hypothetical protein
LRAGSGGGPIVLTLSYRWREHRRRRGQAVVGDAPVDRLSHPLGVTVPSGDHIGGDTRRAHPRDIGVPQLAERDRLESGDLDAIKVVLQVHDRKVRLFGLAAPVAVRVGPEPPTDVEFFEQAVELITAITSVPGGRDELLRGLGHPDMPCSTQSAEWLSRKVDWWDHPVAHGNETYRPESGADGEIEPWSNL